MSTVATIQCPSYVTIQDSLKTAHNGTSFSNALHAKLDELVCVTLPRLGEEIQTAQGELKSVELKSVELIKNSLINEIINLGEKNKQLEGEIKNQDERLTALSALIALDDSKFDEDIQRKINKGLNKEFTQTTYFGHTKKLDPKFTELKNDVKKINVEIAKQKILFDDKRCRLDASKKIHTTLTTDLKNKEKEKANAEASLNNAYLYALGTGAAGLAGGVVGAMYLPSIVSYAYEFAYDTTVAGMGFVAANPISAGVVGVGVGVVGVGVGVGAVIKVIRDIESTYHDMI